MDDTVIQVDGLSKSYRLGQRQGYKTLRDSIASWARNPLRHLPGRRRRQSQDDSVFWALDRVSFEVKRGEVVGIIGRNGAGKSTLLKILSRITEPDHGRAIVHGRVGSLLEVGTGFHPELSGRENIYLCGSILGMRRREIDRKFDEIVAFSEVEKFLDMPVKHYSSGMYMRLAFAVAAHLEPEILFVDEVLAVGDIAFQKKCMEKMSAISQTDGKSILLVTHNLGSVDRICDKVLWLDKGQVVDFSRDVGCMVRRYLESQEPAQGNTEWTNSGDQFRHPCFTVTRFCLADPNGQTPTMPIANNDDIWVQVEGQVERLDPSLNVGYALYTCQGQLLYWSCHCDTAPAHWPEVRNGKCVLRGKIPRRLLNEGIYRLELIVALYCREWIVQPEHNAPRLHFSVKGNLSDSPLYLLARPGLLAPIIDWEGAAIGNSQTAAA